jgi:hypothetical protein
MGLKLSIWAIVCILPNRVRRLGEFLLIWRLFTLGSGLKITEVEHISGLLFSTVPDAYLF